MVLPNMTCRKAPRPTAPRPTAPRPTAHRPTAPRPTAEVSSNIAQKAIDLPLFMA